MFTKKIIALGVLIPVLGLTGMTSVSASEGEEFDGAHLPDARLNARMDTRLSGEVKNILDDGNYEIVFVGGVAPAGEELTLERGDTLTIVVTDETIFGGNGTIEEGEIIYAVGDYEDGALTAVKVSDKNPLKKHKLEKKEVHKLHRTIMHIESIDYDQNIMIVKDKDGNEREIVYSDDTQIFSPGAKNELSEDYLKEGVKVRVKMGHNDEEIYVDKIVIFSSSLE